LTSLFANVKGAIQLTNGTIVVADGGNDELLYHDPNGEFLLSAGREGEGPGEFQGISWIDECQPNMAYVFDFALDRISIFDTEGELVDSFRIEAPSGTTPSTVRCQLGGEFIIVGRPSVAAVKDEGPYRPVQPISVAGPNGSVTHVLGSLPGGERYRYPTSAGPRPLGKVLVADIAGDRFYVGNGDSYMLRVFSTDGIELSPIGRDLEPRAIAPVLDRILEASLKRVPDENRRRALSQRFSEMEYPEFLPPYLRIEADTEGNLWIQPYTLPGETPAWDVFDGDTGDFLGSVDLPEDLTLFQVGADYVLGKTVGDLGVQRVVKYRLIK